MKALKKILLALVILIGLLVVASLFMSRDFNMEQSIVMNGAIENAFDQVNDLNKWQDWSAWDQIDSAMKSEFPGATSGTGAVKKWSSDHPQVGNGSMTITESTPNEVIKIDLNFMENGVGFAEYWFEKTDEGVKVTSKFKSDLPPVIGPFIKMMMAGEIEKMTNKSLEAMKGIVESMPAPSNLKISQISIDNAQWLLSITDTFDLKQLSTIHGELYGEISGFMKENSIQEIGAPVSIWHKWDPDGIEIIMEAGIPVQDSVKTTGRIKMSKINPCKAISAMHMGDYMTLENSHNTMNEWITANNAEIAGAPWEVYLTDPGVEKDTAKWQTAIFYPIK